MTLAGHTGDCARRRRLHTSAVDDPRTPRCASLSGRGAVSVFSPSIVFSFLELTRSAETSSSRRRSSHRPKLAAAARFPRAPSHLTSPRTSAAPSQPRLSHFPAGIEATAADHREPTAGVRPLADEPPPPLLEPIEGSYELPCSLLILSDRLPG